MVFQSALEVANAWIKAYYLDQKMDATLDCMTDDIQWIGIEFDYNTIGKNELKRLFESKTMFFPDSYIMKTQSMVWQELNDNTKMCFIKGYGISEKEFLPRMNIYATLCCVHEGKSWLISTIHITHTKIMKEEQEKNSKLQGALEDARQASYAKTEFLSRISHDMRTPMNGILGIAELSKEVDNPVILHEYIEKIKSSGEYLLALLNDTLDFQKIESGQMVLDPKVVTMKEVLENVKNMTQRSAEEQNIELQMILDKKEDICYIRADVMRLKQIFMNLISNAIKFTPSGGKVEVLGECKKENDFNIQYKVMISDNGIGMSEDFLTNRIFLPFSQEYSESVSRQMGSGLGLSIVKQLIELMDGTIEVESELGAGSKFTVYLEFPKVKDSLEEEVIELEEIKVDNLTGKKILLAEDHPLNAEVAIKLLEKVKCQVTWIRNGKECVELWKNSPPNQYDLILMDIRMPVMDGLEATREIRNMEREDAKEIPIVAMTANAYVDDMKESFLAGMNEHITKPFRPKKMYQVLSKVLEKSRVYKLI
ncbi:MAG: hybrid sensor histidine kinase/response regulator [Anaerostipes sp.]